MQLQLRPLPGTIQTAVIESSGTATVTGVAAQAGLKILVWGFLLTLESGRTLTFKSGTTTLIGALSTTGVLREKPPGGNPVVDQAYPVLETVAGEALNLILDAAAVIGGVIMYSTAAE